MPQDPGPALWLTSLNANISGRIAKPGAGCGAVRNVFTSFAENVGPARVEWVEHRSLKFSVCTKQHLCRTGTGRNSCVMQGHRQRSCSFFRSSYRNHHGTKMILWEKHQFRTTSATV